MGQWIGYGKFVFSSSEKAAFAERQRRIWNSKWITISRLKAERWWTDKMIRDFLGKPKKIEKYKVFSISTVRDAESRKDFIAIMRVRIEKKRVKHERDTCGINLSFIPPAKL
jgi:cytochrome c2